MKEKIEALTEALKINTQLTLTLVHNYHRLDDNKMLKDCVGKIIILLNKMTPYYEGAYIIHDLISFHKIRKRYFHYVINHNEDIAFIRRCLGKIRSGLRLDGLITYVVPTYEQFEYRDEHWLITTIGNAQKIPDIQFAVEYGSARICESRDCDLITIPKGIINKKLFDPNDLIPIIPSKEGKTDDIISLKKARTNAYVFNFAYYNLREDYGEEIAHEYKMEINNTPYTITAFLQKNVEMYLQMLKEFPHKETLAKYIFAKAQQISYEKTGKFMNKKAQMREFIQNHYPQLLNSVDELWYGKSRQSTLWNINVEKNRNDEPKLETIIIYPPVMGKDFDENLPPILVNTYSPNMGIQINNNLRINIKF